MAEMESASAPSSKVLDDKSLWDLVNELYDQRTKWKRIGLGLSVPKSDLEAMSGNDDYDCLENMLSKWLKGINPPPSWERLVAVLCSKVVDEEKKAKEIEDKFCAVVISTTDGSSKALDGGAPSFVNCASETNSDVIPLGSPVSGTESVSSGPLSPGAQFSLPLALVPETSQFFSSDDSFAGRITKSRARPSLMSALEKITDPKIREKSLQKDFHFRTLVRKTYQCLSGVITTTNKFNDFKVAITLLPASLDGHHIVISPDDQQVIASAKTVVQIIIVLNQYWTFVQYELLDYVVQEFTQGNDILMNEMKAYIADMNEFEAEIGIDHFTALQLCSPRSNSVAMEVHLSGSQHKLHNYRLIQQSMAQQCGLHPHTVRTHETNPGGSTIFTLHLPYSVAGHVLAVLRGMPLARELLSKPLEERKIYFMDEAETEMFLPMKKFVFDTTEEPASFPVVLDMENVPFPGRLERGGVHGSISELSAGYATMSIESGETEMKKIKKTEVLKKPMAICILGSVAPHSNESVVPQSPADLSDDDQKVLKELDLPQEKWNNLNALLALYNKSECRDVFSVQVSRPGMELSRSYILEQIEFLLANSAKKHGAILYYYGNGRRNTGDWCFRDGFITFRDIADLYMKHGRGRVLAIVSDCHSSGRWVSECAKFLDEQGVKPCGHSAREKGILLKVYASCRTGQDSAVLAYTTRAMELKEDGFVYHYITKELSAQQKTLGVDFKAVRCGKGEKEECGIASDATWSNASYVINHRKFVVRGKDRGLPAWHFVLLHDDAENIKNFFETVASGTVDVADYGKILKSGWGKEPTAEEREWAEKYGDPQYQ